MGNSALQVRENQVAQTTQYLEYYRLMVRIRRCEERIGWLFSRGLTMGTAHLSIGQEASAVGVLSTAAECDQVVSTHRGHGHLIAKGGSPAAILAEICGRATGYCRGKGGSQHMAVRNLNFLGTNGITGGGIPVATGAALAAKTLKTGAVVYSFFGDGAANQGMFHESLNMAAIWDLPIVYVCENNSYAMYTPQSRVTSVVDIASRAAGYGIPGVIVDGMDILEVRQAAIEAREHASSGNGPILLEVKTYRFCGHSKSDTGGSYRPREEISAWQERDGLPTFRRHLLHLGIPESELCQIESDVDTEIDTATQFALDSEFAVNEALTGAYANQSPRSPSDAAYDSVALEVGS